MNPEELTGPGVRFWTLLRLGETLACGALKDLSDGTAEVKSVHVCETARGQGLGVVLMAFLIKEARRSGYSALVLETGTADGYAAARRLYFGLGFEICGPIPGYRRDPLSAFMRLPLDAPGARAS